jgi:hypothetical protein
MPVRMIGRPAHRALRPADCRRRGGRDGSPQTAQGTVNSMETLMGKQRNQPPKDNIFAGNPFLDDLLAWRHSPEGEQFAEFADVLCGMMEDMQLDARKRQFIWPDGERLDLDRSATRIQAQNPDWCRDWIEEYLIDWIEMDYAPEHYSAAQFDELDRLTARWIADHLRRTNTTKTQRRTRHS